MSSIRSVVAVSVRLLFRRWAKPIVVAVRTRSGVLDVVGIHRPTACPDAVPPGAGTVMDQR
jgi:hypothetical protein